MQTQVVGRRVVAFLIDAVIVGAIDAALLAALGHSNPGPGVNYSVEGAPALAYFALVLIVNGSYLGVLPGVTGVTLGKLLLGLRLVGEDGAQPPGVARGIARWFLLLADAFPYIVPCLVGFVVALASKRNQRIGDTVASTLVIRRAPLPPAAGPAV